MAAQFDPYHKWLGIPPEEQPPNHYRLLGISLFESDPDVVEASADRIMHFLQSVATGPHLNDSQRLLNEVAAARVCLLNSKKKSEYDATLQVESSGTWFKVCVAAGIAATITLVAFLIWFWGSKPNEFEIVESQPEIQDATSVVITKPETSTTDKIDQTPTTEVSITQNDDPTTPAESVPEPEVIEKASRDLKQQAIEELKKQARDITPENDTAITQRSVNAKYRDIILIRESERTDRIAQIRRERDVLLQQVGDSQQKLKSSQTAWNLAKREYKALDVQARAVKRSAAAVTAQGQQVQRQLNIETDSNAISELRSQLRNLRNAFSRLGSQLKTLQTTAARVTANARKLETKITEEQVFWTDCSRVRQNLKLNGFI